MKKIVIFASGSGTNAENISEYFKDHRFISVAMILSNNREAYVLDRAKKYSIPSMVFNKMEFYNTDKVTSMLLDSQIDLIVLAGFMWLIPVGMIRAFPKKIINIHPALLPRYGGKGMYGMKVHEAVAANRDKESGISIHYVNEKYDEGEIIFQARCKLASTDTPDEIAQKVHKLEYKHYPVIIEKLLS